MFVAQHQKQSTSLIALIADMFIACVSFAIRAKNNLLFRLAFVCLYLLPVWTKRSSETNRCRAVETIFDRKHENSHDIRRVRFNERPSTVKRTHNNCDCSLVALSFSFVQLRMNLKLQCLNCNRSSTRHFESLFCWTIELRVKEAKKIKSNRIAFIRNCQFELNCHNELTTVKCETKWEAISKTAKECLRTLA